MEPVELETIMRNRAGNGSAGNSQNPSGMEQSMDTFTAGYDKQIETVKQLEQQLESLKTKLDSLPSGALSKGLNAGMGLAVTNLENAKRALTDLNKIVSAGTTAADLFGAQQQKIATIEATLQSVMTLTNGVLTVYESTIKKSGPIHEILILAKEKLALANVKLATTLGISNLAAQALMGTLTLGLSVAITGLVYAWNKYSESQEEAKRKQEEAREVARKEAEEEERLRLSVAGGIVSQLVEYKKLQMQYVALGDNMQKKKKFVEENQSAFQRLGLSISGVGDAESLLVTNESGFLESLRKRALAAASMEIAAAEYKKAIEKMIEADNYKVPVDKNIADAVAKRYNDVSINPENEIGGENVLDSLTNAGKEVLLNKAAEYINKGDKALETVVEKLREVDGTGGKKEKPHKKEQPKDEQIEKYVLENEEKLKEQTLAIARGEKEREINLEKDGIARKRKLAQQEYEDEKRRIENIEKAIKEMPKGKQEAHGADLDKLRAGLGVQKANAKTILESKNAVIDAEEKEKQEKELHDLLKKYQSFTTKRKELDKQYDEESAKLKAQNKETLTETQRQQVEEAIKLLEKRKAAAIKTLEEEEKSSAASVLQATDTWKLITEDASKKSIKNIRDILAQAQELYDYLDGKEGAKLPENVNSQDVEKLKGDKGFMKNLKGIISTKTDDLSKKNPFEGFIAKSGNLFDSLKSGKPEEIQKGIDGLGESFRGCTAFLNGMGTSLGQVFGEDVSYAINQAMGLAQSVFDVGSGAARIASGDILGGISSMVSGISSIFAMGKKTKAENEKVRKQLEANERKSYLAEFEINELYRQRYEWAKKIGESTLQHIQRQGEELDKQAKANQREQDELWEKLTGTKYKQSETYEHGTWFRKAKINTEWESLQGKSWEEIELLAAAGKLSDEGMQYYEALKKAKEEGDDLATRQEEYMESVRETFTGTSYDSFVSSIVDGFKAGKRSAEDFANSFEELMKGAVSSSIQMMADKESRKFYEEWAALADDEDGLTDEDINTLRAKYQELMERITEKGEQAEKITGVSVLDDSGSSQKGPEAGAFTTMSQEQGTKLEGLFTSLQDHAISIDDKMTDMSTVMFDSFDTLNRIADHTSCLMGMAADINEMKRDGIKMR